MKNTGVFLSMAVVGGLMTVAAMSDVASAATLPLPDEAAEKLAREKLAVLTLEEKTSLCALCATMYLNAIPHAGIDREWSFNDCGHTMKPEHNRDRWGYVEGVDDRSTALPCISALASTWNPALAEAHGHVMGEQMRSRDKSQMLGPGINIIRNPLCGRNWEYMSEDPAVVVKMVPPLVRAVQSHGVAITPKHYCLNGQELNRFDSSMTIDDRALEEIYLPGFAAAVRDGGALSIMTAYNRVNGTFCSENSYLQKAILRERWGFKGMIVTDWGGQHSCDNAIMNGGGIEANCGRGVHYLCDFYGTHGKDRYPLATAVKEGRVPVAAVDEAALHTLFTMAKTGFFTGEQDKGSRLTEAHRDVAVKIGEEAIVLAKNAKGVLPLDKAKTKKIVVFGQIADLEQAQLGSSCECHIVREITFLKGLEDYLGADCEITSYPLGSEGGDGNPMPIDHLILETFDPNGADAFAERAWERRHYRGGKELSLVYDKTTEAGWKHNASVPGEGPVDLGDTIEWKSSLVAPENGEYEFLAEQSNYSTVSIEVGGKTLVDHMSGKVKGVITLQKGASCPVAFRFHVGDAVNNCRFGWMVPSARRDTPEKVKAAVVAADAVLVFTGTTMGFGRAKETEGSDRPDMKAAEGHDEEIAKILSWGKPNTVIICRTGSAIELPWLEKCDTMLITSYLGQEAGRPMAKALFGEVNPSGKLTYSWPKVYADSPTGRFGERAYNPTNSIFLESIYVGYRWYEKRAISVDFPFGHGLSYTRFDYGAFDSAPKGEGEWNVKVAVRNAGERDGAEVVQLYTAQINPEIDRPLKELRNFRKIFLKAGAAEAVDFKVTARDFAYFDVLSRKFRADPGEYEILVGSSSADIRARLRVRLDRTFYFAP